MNDDKTCNKPKKPRSVPKRTSNYTSEEKLLLVNIISKYKNVIECKKTNGSTWAEKNAAWEKISEEFNAESAQPRDKDSLKKCYENKKREVRKIAAQNKQAIRLTGGGKFTPKDDPCLGVVMEITKKETIVGLSDEFGGDAESDAGEKPNGTQEVHDNTELLDEEVYYLVTAEEDMGEELLLETSNIQAGTSENGNAGSEKKKWNSYKAADLKNKPNPKLRVTENSDRRRPKFITPVHTNFLSKQYSEVAALKEKYLSRELEIMQNKEDRINSKEEREIEEYVLRKRALHLDIEIKELQLKKLKSSFF